MFKKPLIHFLSLLLLLTFAQISLSEENDKSEESEKEVSDEQKEEEKEYIKDKVEDFESSEGFIQVYQDPETSSLYFKIKESQLNKEIIYFAHVKDGVVAARKNRGSYLDNGILKFEKHFDTLRLIRVNTNFYFDEESALSKSSGANISNSVIKVFPINSMNEEEDEFLINVSSLFVSESLTPIKPIPYPDGPPPDFVWGQLSAEKSRILSFHNYPQNTDVEIEYVFENPPSYGYEEEDAADPRNISISLRYSLIQMPENDFEPRLADQRVGYFTERITDLTSVDLTPYNDLINKWDLQKKNPEEALSEPIKPITFWLENSTPKELIPYIKEGVLAWNAAFEKAGFKNAVAVKVQPDDADWDAGDIRYNVLRWTSSPNPPFGGYGPSFTNPRTGEIIGADIMLEWVYLTNRININTIFPINEENLCHAGSQMQEGNILANIVSMDPTGNTDPKIVKQSIVRLTLHEVGHTLGLNHNFKASHLHDPVSVHDPLITQKSGVTASVMEYPAVNIAPLGVDQGDYYDVVTGAYDNWAIEFGYTPNLSDQERDQILFRSDEPELIFGNDADDMRSPTLFRESGRSLQTVSRFVGGVYVNRSTPNQDSELRPFEPVSEEVQKRAMQVLNDHAFSPNAFPINEEILTLIQKERRGFDFRSEHEDPQVHRNILSIQTSVLDHLLNGWTLDRMTDSSLYGNTYSVNQMLSDLTDSIFIEDANSSVSTIRQNLQTSYLRRLIKMVDDDSGYQMTSAAAYSSIRNIEKIAKRRSQDPDTQAHRDFLLWLIDSALDD